MKEEEEGEEEEEEERGGWGRGKEKEEEGRDRGEREEGKVEEEGEEGEEMMIICLKAEPTHSSSRWLIPKTSLTVFFLYFINHFISFCSQ